MLNYADQSLLDIILPGNNSTVLDSCNASVSRAIDQACNRVFYTETGDKVYDTNTHTEIIINDLLTATKVYLDDMEISSSCYEFLPLNSTPKTSIKLIGITGDRLKISGRWGYSNTIPEDIVHIATVLTRIDYQITMSKAISSERALNYNATYAPIESTLPVAKYITDLVQKYRRYV